MQRDIAELLLCALAHEKPVTKESGFLLSKHPEFIILNKYWSKALCEINGLFLYFIIYTIYYSFGAVRINEKIAIFPCKNGIK